MPGIEIKVEFTPDISKQLQTASYKIVHAVDKALLDSAILLTSEVKKKIQRGGRGGLRYSVNGKGSQRSAPGEPPKSDTGMLVRMMHWEHSFLSASVGSSVHYAGYLELGTSKMAPRPYLQPTLDENQEKIQDMIERAMQGAL
jgi:HK97 gp10 family phage protein